MTSDFFETFLINTFLFPYNHFVKIPCFFLVKLIGAVINWLLWFDEKNKCTGSRSYNRKRKSELKAARFKNRGNFFCQILTRDFFFSFNLTRIKSYLFFQKSSCPQKSSHLSPLFWWLWSRQRSRKCCPIWDIGEAHDMFSRIFLRRIDEFFLPKIR